LIGNNVYAHVPDINNFTEAIEKILKPNGVVTLEFPHVQNLIQQVQFDTIYHEHFSYLSLIAVTRIFDTFGMRIFDVEKIPTHGGSLRVYGCKKPACWEVSPSVVSLLKEESTYGLDTLQAYSMFQKAVWPRKYELMSFLLEKKNQGQIVCGYGAAAKSNTLLNYCGVKADLLPFIFDGAESKQGLLMPGSHIPIIPPNKMADLKPDFIIIFPWNIQSEVLATTAYAKSWGAQFVELQPKLRVLE
jgi:hypothetical protein